MHLDAIVVYLLYISPTSCNNNATVLPNKSMFGCENKQLKRWKNCQNITSYDFNSSKIKPDPTEVTTVK
jgi:hypothetical protein